MVAGFSQYSPQQVLEAGRRAEADGKLDYAVQFYSYVVSQYAGLPEAADAAEALRRLEIYEPDNRGLTAGGPAQPSYGGGPQNYVPTNPQGSAGYSPQSTYAGPVTGPPSRAQTQPASAPPNSQRSPVSETGAAASPSAKTRRRQTARNGAAPAQSYRVGRVMAALLGFCGWVGIVAGLVQLGSSLVLTITKAPNGLLAAMAAGPVVAVGVLAAACVAILLSQMARATFDAAGRGRAGHDDEDADD